MILYLDTSAAMKLVVDETESAALARYLADLPDSDRIVSSRLLQAELGCVAARHPDAVDPVSVAAVLHVLDLVELVRADLVAAPMMPNALRTNDALHLATAVRVGAEAIVSYDLEQCDAARSADLRVIAPA